MKLIYAIYFWRSCVHGWLTILFQEVSDSIGHVSLWIRLGQKMEYCYHIWAGDVQSSLSNLDRVQNHLHNFLENDKFATLQPLTHWHNIASMLLLYQDHHSLFPPVLTFNVMTYHATSLESKNPYFFHNPNIRKMFHSVFSMKCHIVE